MSKASWHAPQTTLGGMSPAAYPTTVTRWHVMIRMRLAALRADPFRQELHMRDHWVGVSLPRRRV